MKAVPKLGIVALIALTSGGASAELYKDYQFGDTGGTTIGGAVNNVSGGGAFASSATIDGVAADGAGSLRFESAVNATKNDNLKLDGALTAVAAGQVTMDFKLTDWQFSNGGDAMQFLLVDTTGGLNAGMKVTVDWATDDFGDKLRINWVPSNVGAFSNQRQKLASGSATNNGSFADGVIIRTVMDLDAGTYTGQYSLDDGASWLTKVDAGALGTQAQYDQFRIGVTDAAVTGWAAGNFATVDYVTVDVIPEPATLGMVALFGSSILFIRRRFMM